MKPLEEREDELLLRCRHSDVFQRKSKLTTELGAGLHFLFLGTGRLRVNKLLNATHVLGSVELVNEPGDE